MSKFRFEVWPTEYRVITQHFAANPRNYAQFGLPGHDGVDIRAPSGSKVFAVAPGEVFRVHDQPTGHNYGIHVRIMHQDGYKTIYGHLQKAFVRTGQIVEAGAILGLADNTGNSYGSHLHLTLKKVGAKVNNWPYNIIDPTPFLLPLLGWQEPAGPFLEGWLLSDAVYSKGKLAQINAGGATLYVDQEHKVLVPAGTIVIVLASQGQFMRVKVPQAAVGLNQTAGPKPAPEPPPIVATLDGWAWKRFLTVVGRQAVVGSHGINLRAKPDQRAGNIGLVKANSTVSVLGQSEGLYLPVRARRDDFQGAVNLPHPPPDPTVIPPKDGYLGWALTQYLSPAGNRQALASHLGVNLRSKPDGSGQNIGLVKAYATVTLAGPPREAYTPVMVRGDDVINAIDKAPGIELPDPWPEEESPKPSPKPHQDTTPGWSFTNGLTVAGNSATVARHGSNLREAPRRDATKVGYIPPGSKVIVTGPAQGEYTPVRVPDDVLEPPTDDADDPDSDTSLMGKALIGLHASADPDISEAEHQEFAALRPGIIKVLSFHSEDDIARLATAHPDAHFIVRAFLSFGNRRISPSQFLEDTIKDVRRALKALSGHKVVVELHNEPNTTLEGLGSSWSDGSTFSAWWLALLKAYRSALPGGRFIYPGLSPGTTV
ncbi:MAG: peptidoglycan DD-metalloendopeptidase family protein, partial [Candidatus Promineifilaceae bacterium]